MHKLAIDSAERGAAPERPLKDTLALQPAALHGLAGEVVNTILPFTEADPAALLTYLLSAFGNVVGHNAHWKMERTPHFLNLFVVMVGDTARGRKGSSRSTLDYIFDQVDRDWRRDRMVSGLSSGQGLIWHVRDPIEEEHDGVTTVVDEGVADKRLFVVEEEFAHVLKLTPTEGNILSASMREAWDSGNLQTLVSGRKAPPVRATGAHISVVGHITKMELLRYLEATEAANGFGNRFIWLVVQRSKLIANPTGTPDHLLNQLIEKVGKAKEFAQTIGEIRRDDRAAAAWEAVYPKLTADVHGMAGTLLARAAPQVMRLACLYALLDRSRAVRAADLCAALALWQFCETSVREIFGDALGDPTADKIVAAIAQSPRGMARTEINDLFNRHKGGTIEAALAWLVKIGWIEEKIEPTPGRPRSLYVLKVGSKP